MIGLIVLRTCNTHGALSTFRNTSPVLQKVAVDVAYRLMRINMRRLFSDVHRWRFQMSPDA
jgi:hypothetical protein